MIRELRVSDRKLLSLLWSTYVPLSALRGEAMMAKWPWWCCQRCGAEIGLLGRALWWFPIALHPCKRPDRILVDREGIAYPPTRKVEMRAKQ